MTEFFRPSTAS